MREIKFRARKVTEGHPWVFGYLEVRQSALGKGAASIYVFQDWGLNSREPVDIDTVGQFTGLKDFADKEIYEGDIVKHEQYPAPLVVQWDYDQWGLFDGICNEASIGVDDIEVIGNIYENPELLAS